MLVEELNLSIRMFYLKPASAKLFSAEKILESGIRVHDAEWPPDPKSAGKFILEKNQTIVIIERNVSFVVEFTWLKKIVFTPVKKKDFANFVFLITTPNQTSNTIAGFENKNLQNIIHLLEHGI